MTQPKGIKLIEPSEGISEEYFKRANEDLDAMEQCVGTWRVVIAYYACYSALYALLMRAGIKCEIHDCTLELVRLIDGLSESDYAFLTELKKNRINAQYYLKTVSLKDTSQVKNFVFKCKNQAEHLDIEKLRNEAENGKN